MHYHYSLMRRMRGFNRCLWYSIVTSPQEYTEIIKVNMRGDDVVFHKEEGESAGKKCSNPAAPMLLGSTG